MSVCIKDLIQNMNLVIGCNIGCSYCYARNNCRRYHITDDFSMPEFYPGKLRLMGNPKPHNWLLTGMSDLAGWKDEWRELVFDKMRQNVQHQYLFLSKRPDLLHMSVTPDNGWFGVTVTSSKEMQLIDQLRENVGSTHLHVTFEPMFNDIGEVDLHGISWIVIGTETGKRKGKAVSEVSWVENLTEQAHRLNIPVFMKEDLVPIMGEANMVQELPQEFKEVLKQQGYDYK